MLTFALCACACARCATSVFPFFCHRARTVRGACRCAQVGDHFDRYHSEADQTGQPTLPLNHHCTRGCMQMASAIFTSPMSPHGFPFFLQFRFVSGSRRRVRGREKERESERKNEREIEREREQAKAKEISLIYFSLMTPRCARPPFQTSRCGICAQAMVRATGVSRPITYVCVSFFLCFCFNIINGSWVCKVGTY